MIPRQVIRQQQIPPSNHISQGAQGQAHSIRPQSSIGFEPVSVIKTVANETNTFSCPLTKISLSEKDFDDATNGNGDLKADMSMSEREIFNAEIQEDKDGDKNNKIKDNDELTLFLPKSDIGDSSERELSLISNKCTQQNNTTGTLMDSINEPQNVTFDSSANNCSSRRPFDTACCSPSSSNSTTTTTIAENIIITEKSCHKENKSNYLIPPISFEKELSEDDCLRNTLLTAESNAAQIKCLHPLVEENTFINDDNGNTTENVNNKAVSSNGPVLNSFEMETEMEFKLMEYNDIQKLKVKNDEEVFISSTLNDSIRHGIPESKHSDFLTKNDNCLALNLQNSLSGNLEIKEPLLLTHPELNRHSYQERKGQVFQAFELTSSQNDPEMNMLNTESTVANDLRYSLTTTSVPSIFASACREFQGKYADNFLRGCKWSPDGNCVLTNSNDNCLRVFQPFETINQNRSDMEMVSKVVMKESGQIYDFVWQPRMSLWQPEFCRVASTCTGIPIHMWDTTTGNIVANYRAYDQYDEVTAAYSLSFSLDGSKIYAGYNKAIRIFDTEYPVRSCKLVKTFNTQKKDGQTGIISCFTHSPNRDGLYVAGSYSRHIGIYDSACDRLVCLIQGQHGGITHLKFSPDGSKLYSGGRKDAEILCWDVRNMGKILFSALRDVKTNQRIYFDLSQSGRYLVSGNNDGTVAFWDTLSSFEEINGDVFLRPCSQFVAHDDCVNGVSFNCQYDMIATASGQRHFRNFDKSDSDDSDQDCKIEDTQHWDFSLKLWKMPLVQDEMMLAS